MYTLERFYIISKFFKSENDRNARPTTHNISQQRQKEFLLKDVMKLHEGHEFMEKILTSGLKKSEAPIKIIKINKKVIHRDNEKFISIEPSKLSLDIDFELKYQNPVIGNQKNKINVYEDDLTDIFNSRTFCLYEDIEKLKKLNLGKGGSLENAIVIKNTNIDTYGKHIQWQILNVSKDGIVSRDYESEIWTEDISLYEESIFNQDLNGDGAIGIDLEITLQQAATDTDNYGDLLYKNRQTGAFFILDNKDTESTDDDELIFQIILDGMDTLIENQDEALAYLDKIRKYLIKYSEEEGHTSARTAFILYESE